ncbi:LLM class flavin-dependent oxidoreductase [Saccharospirillum mangrovi]|uniref:LLM class flavin-dependent oxidoreductase n=1 Tax=Saccharospirillum mangrovi TaxID=2161747 RepID=UPI000D352F8A|nr:LLM class flavin-dependent oxidoreductase [Saccharospirillum mangrovi]
MTAYSVLDLAPVTEGSDIRQALHNSRDLARHVEQLGFTRFWMAEHHNMTGVASAATAVALGFVASGTERIRIGSGGVMLPNHSPLVIAEQYGTLAELYPDRVDLGLGRAPGTDGATMQALRRDPMTAADRFPDDVQELQAYLEPLRDGQRIKAVPGYGTRIPIWLLGSSLYSAQLAAALGLPFAFASHFAPDMLDQALAIYRERFQPSAFMDTPYSAAAANLFAADTDAEGRRLQTSMMQQFVALRRGTPGKMPPPVDDIDSIGSPMERMQVEHALVESAVGSPQSVRRWLAAFISRTQVDEVILNGPIFDHAARLKSFSIAAEAMQGL